MRPGEPSHSTSRESGRLRHDLVLRKITAKSCLIRRVRLTHYKSKARRVTVVKGSSEGFLKKKGMSSAIFGGAVRSFRR